VGKRRHGRKEKSAIEKRKKMSSEAFKNGEKPRIAAGGGDQKTRLRLTFYAEEEKSGECKNGDTKKKKGEEKYIYREIGGGPPGFSKARMPEKGEKKKRYNGR